MTRLKVSGTPGTDVDTTHYNHWGRACGSEAALQAADRGVGVDLFEMRPTLLTPAHQTGQFAELVCSNSFGSDAAGSAPRLLKDELEFLGARVLHCARQHTVPAGNSLAVDRQGFSAEVTRAIESHPLIEIHRTEVAEIPASGVVVIATGPLTSDALAKALCEKVGQESLYFYDAISPIVAAES